MGRLLITASVFVACFAVAHIPVLYGQRLRRRGRFDAVKWKRWWEASDYLWLGLTVLGLLAATGEVRRMIGLDDLKTSRARAESCVSIAMTNASASREVLQLQRLPPDTPGLAEADKALSAATQRAYDAFPLWNDANSSISTTQEEQAPSLLDRAREKYDAMISAAAGIPDRWADQRRRLQADASQARSCMRDVKDALARSRKDNLNAMLTMFAPWILAAGLALRFAKVTAKLNGQV
jgi:hypothetical protein